MEENYINTILERVVQALFLDYYCIKLCKALKTSNFSIEKINSYYISYLFIDNNRCFYCLNQLLVPKNLHLLVIKEKHDQIAAGHLDYQKIINFIT